MKKLTEPLFFDTDCISAFLWVDNESILPKLYPGRIVIPMQVYNELSNPAVNKVKGIKSQIDLMLERKEIMLESIEVGSSTYDLFTKLTLNPDEGHKIIGLGEASCIALAVGSDGILASNNLRDIQPYIQEFGIKHVTTADIMIQAYHLGFISEKQGNDIWKEMLSKKRRLGYQSFSECMKEKRKC